MMAERASNVRDSASLAMPHLRRYNLFEAQCALDKHSSLKGLYGMAVPSGSQAAPGPLARAISAQVRVLMAEQNMTAQALAQKSGLSRSYLGKRLRDELSLTSNDIEALIHALDVDIITFANDAVRRIKKP